MKIKNIKILLVSSCQRTQYEIVEYLSQKSSTIRAYTNAELALNDWEIEKAYYDVIIFDKQFNAEHLLRVNEISQKIKIIFIANSKECLLEGERITTIIHPTTNKKLLEILEKKIFKILAGGYRMTEQKKIMVVDDEESMCSKENHNKIDLLISDVRMPKMNGIEMVEEMKEIKPGIKVIFVSGAASVYPDLKPIIEKPFDIKVFQKLIKKELEK